MEGYFYPTHSHINKHCGRSVQPRLTSGCTTGRARAGELARGAGSTQALDSFRRPLMFFASPGPLATPSPPVSPSQEIAFCPLPQQINEAGEGLHTVTSRPGLSHTATCSLLAACAPVQHPQLASGREHTCAHTH